jgi:16S rRNA (cytosine1402-N4)-methyltransferase
MSDETQSAAAHMPVLLGETMALLMVSDGGLFLDGTFGGGGHSKSMLLANEKNFVYATDCDPSAKKRAQDFLQNYANFRFYRLNFAEIDRLELPPLNGILLDLGISSFQLAEHGRGFSFHSHDLVDMRMDNESGMTAAKFLASASERDLVRAIRDYGEEENWKKIVKTIVESRGGTIFTCDNFAKLVVNCIGGSRHGRIHAATKTFQGIRIFINDELRSLENALPMLFEKLTIGGRLAVISFHSLEDRIVKRFFNAMAGKAIDRFDDSPKQDRVAQGNILTKKPITPHESEINANPRSRSAKLRVLEKTAKLRQSG